MSAKYLFSDNAKKILRHLQANAYNGEDFKTIAAAVGLDPRVTNCTITSSLVRRGFAERIQKENGFKVVSLTEAGRKISPDELVE